MGIRPHPHGEWGEDGTNWMGMGWGLGRKLMGLGWDGEHFKKFNIMGIGWGMGWGRGKISPWGWDGDWGNFLEKMGNGMGMGHNPMGLGWG